MRLTTARRRSRRSSLVAARSCWEHGSWRACKRFGTWFSFRAGSSRWRPSMCRAALAVLFAIVSLPAFAQAPKITPAGDPSVRNDTIYKLAVDPAEYEDEDYIYLLDDGVVRFEADGRGSRTYRQVI